MNEVQIRHRKAVYLLLLILSLAVGVGYSAQIGKSSGWVIGLALVGFGFAGWNVWQLRQANFPVLRADSTGISLGNASSKISWHQLTEVAVCLPKSFIQDGYLRWQQRDGEPGVIRLGIATIFPAEIYSELVRLAQSKCQVNLDLFAQPAPTSLTSNSVSTKTTEIPIQLTEVAQELPESGVSAAKELALKPVLPLRAARPASRVELNVSTEFKTAKLPVPAPIVKAVPTSSSHSKVPGAGSLIYQARTNQQLSITQLGTKTRIRTHILQGIERGDYTGCGGDFYAQGHLRAIAKALQIPAEPLLADYQQNHALAPVQPSKIFEKELVTQQRLNPELLKSRATWVLSGVASLMLFWYLGTSLTSLNQEIEIPSPQLNGSAGLTSAESQIKPAKRLPVRVRVSVIGTKAKVRIVERGGHIVFSGQVLAGTPQYLLAALPLKVTANPAALVRVRISGKPMGLVGTSKLQQTRKFG